MSIDKEITKHPGGRPTKYKPEYASKPLSYCLCWGYDEDRQITLKGPTNGQSTGGRRLPRVFVRFPLRRKKQMLSCQSSRATLGYEQETVKVFQFQG